MSKIIKGPEEVAELAANASTQATTNAAAITALQAEAWEEIDSGNLTAVANLEVTWTTGAYTDIRIELTDVKCSVDATSIGIYALSDSGTVAGPTFAYLNNSFIAVGNAAGEDFSCIAEAKVIPSNTNRPGGLPVSTWHSYHSTAGAYYCAGAVGGCTTSAVDKEVDGIRIQWSSGNFQAVGTYRVLGRTV